MGFLVNKKRTNKAGTDSKERKCHWADNLIETYFRNERLSEEWISPEEKIITDFKNLIPTLLLLRRATSGVVRSTKLLLASLITRQPKAESY